MEELRQYPPEGVRGAISAFSVTQPETGPKWPLPVEVPLYCCFAPVSDV